MIPKLSVIIPVYNGGGKITRCIDSIEDQDVPRSDYEIITVNDGSTDNSLTTLQQLAERYPNITVIDKPNGGASSARNRGIDAARGEYIMFMDADDYVNTGKLGSLLKEAESSPDLIIYGMTLISCNRKSHPMPLAAKEYNGRDILNVYRIETLLLGSQCNKLFRRSVIEENGIRFDTSQKMWEDACFCFEVVRHCHLVKTVPVCFYNYDHTQDSVAGGFHGNVFFRDFPKYINKYLGCVDFIMQKFSLESEASASFNNHVQTTTVFFHLFEIYSLYRSREPHKKQWLKKLTSSADRLSPGWRAVLSKSSLVPATFSRLPLLPAHLFLTVVFGVERVKRGIDKR